MEKYGSAAQLDIESFYIDLHIHSHFSDGLLSPEQIVHVAKENRICAVSITDHDTIAGTAEACRIGKKEGIEIIPGIEISVLYNDCEVHLLGYYIDQASPAIHEYIRLLSNSRTERAQIIVDVLKKQGVNISYELVLQKANGSPIGRPHIAQVMVDEGYVFSAYEAFQKFLGEKRSGDIPKFSLGIQQAVDIIKQAGGLAFWAHPATVQLGDEVLKVLFKCGLDGIETIHPKHTPDQQAQYREIARQFGLLESGGSDCHGREGTLMLGTQKVPVEFLDRIKKRQLSISPAS